MTRAGRSVDVDRIVGHVTVIQNTILCFVRHGGYAVYYPRLLPFLVDGSEGVREWFEVVGEYVLPSKRRMCSWLEKEFL